MTAYYIITIKIQLRKIYININFNGVGFSFKSKYDNKNRLNMVYRISQKVMHIISLTQLQTHSAFFTIPFLSPFIYESDTFKLTVNVLVSPTDGSCELAWSMKNGSIG